MLAILELPEFRRRVAGLTVDAYESLVEQGLAPKRGELIHGAVIEKIFKSPLQVDLAKFIHERFLQQLPAGHSSFSEGPLRFVDFEPEPDISVVRGARADFRGSHPTEVKLVVKVAISSVPLTANKLQCTPKPESINIGSCWQRRRKSRFIQARRQELTRHCRCTVWVKPQPAVACRNSVFRLTNSSSEERTIAFNEQGHVVAGIGSGTVKSW